MRAAIYIRVSTREQEDSGLGLAAQKERCLAELASRSWDLGLLAEETATSAKSLKGRPKLSWLLGALDRGEFDALLVSRLDRLSRSLGEFAEIMDRAHKHGWQIVVLDPPVDMTTAFGRAMAGMAAVFAQLERELISQRTREGLAALKARGVTKDGRPYVPNQPFGERGTIRRIVRLREDGKSRSEIARWLTEAGVPSPGDAEKWNHRTIGRILIREGVA